MALHDAAEHGEFADASAGAVHGLGIAATGDSPEAHEAPHHDPLDGHDSDHAHPDGFCRSASNLRISAQPMCDGLPILAVVAAAPNAPTVASPFDGVTSNLRLPPPRFYLRTQALLL